MTLMNCDQRKDPVSRLVRDLTAEEVADWLVKYHNMPKESWETLVINLREQFRWHRLQGRLDNNTTAALIAELLVMRRSPLTLATPEPKPECS